MYATTDNANCLSQLKTVPTMQDHMHAAKIESNVIDLLLSKCQVNIYIKLDEHLNNSRLTMDISIVHLLACSYLCSNIL